MGSQQPTPRDGCRKWPKNSHFVLTTFLIDFLCTGLGGWHWKLSERVIHGFSRCTTEYGHHRSRSQCISEKWILLRCSCPNKRQWKPWRCKRIKEVTTIWTSNTCMNLNILNFLGYDLSSTDSDSCRYLWCTSFFFHFGDSWWKISVRIEIWMDYCYILLLHHFPSSWGIHETICLGQCKESWNFEAGKAQLSSTCSRHCWIIASWR